jgi:hypothetical protein
VIETLVYVHGVVDQDTNIITYCDRPVVEVYVAVSSVDMWKLAREVDHHTY